MDDKAKADDPNYNLKGDDYQIVADLSVHVKASDVIALMQDMQQRFECGDPYVQFYYNAFAGKYSARVQEKPIR